MKGKEEKPTEKLLRITAKKEGFRRAGLAHSTSPTDHPAGRFTEAEIEALKGEPMLVVQVLE